MSALWRVGNKVPRHVYRGNEPIFTAPTEELAAEVVEAMNLRLKALSACRWCGGEASHHNSETDHTFELWPRS